MAMAGPYSGTRSPLPRANSSPGLQPISVYPVVAPFPAAGVAVRPAIPWWLWWNILSVDAPIVAVFWAALLSRAAGYELRSIDAAILFLAVWLIYMSDRLLDGWTARSPGALQERHLFCQRHRTILVSLLSIAGVAIFLLSTAYLPADESSAGVKLGTVLVAYMLSIHIGRGRWASLLPKELVVGTLFAAGVTLPLWSRFAQLRWQTLGPWLLFASLCSLNCLAIECWETHRFPNLSRTCQHSLVRWGSSRLGPIAAILAIAALVVYAAALFQWGASRPELMAVALGALLLLVLNNARDRFSPEALRVLADAALAVPALIALAVQK